MGRGHRHRREIVADYSFASGEHLVKEAADMGIEPISSTDPDPEDCDPPAVGRISIPILPDLSFDPDPALAAEGWERRFMADPKQVKEATRLYTELGFEVRTERVLPSELSELCGSCALVTCHAYVTVYTRKRGWLMNRE